MITTRYREPCDELIDFVDGFWSLENDSDNPKKVVVLPDGRIDLILSESKDENFHIALLGLGTSAESVEIAPFAKMFSISFRPLAVEYLLKNSVSDLLDGGKKVGDFWDFKADDLMDFEAFFQKAETKMRSLLPETIDSKKRKFFELLFASEGAIAVGELSDKTGWASRQINRYFTDQFGLSLKSYAGILRFRSAFPQLKAGKLFPENHFFDQSHFIREVKKLAGVSPKELSRNQNDRFVQLSALPNR